VAHLSRTRFDILGNLVKVSRQASQHFLQVGLPRCLGQSPGMVGLMVVVRCAVHKLKTPWKANHSPLGSSTPSAHATMKSEPGPPITLDNAAKAEMRLIVWCRRCGR
jgi:hypothetical protein